MFCVSTVIGFTNEYHRDLMIVTDNTAKKPCVSVTHVVFQGDFRVFKQAALESYDIIVELARNGESDKAKQMISNASQNTKNFLSNMTTGTLSFLKLTSSASMGAFASNLGQSLAMGGAFALVGVVVKGISDEIRRDHEYLYIVECNSGQNVTRLITHILSNDKLEEAQWVEMAKRDQARSAQ